MTASLITVRLCDSWSCSSDATAHVMVTDADGGTHQSHVCERHLHEMRKALAERPAEWPMVTMEVYGVRA